MRLYIFLVVAFVFLAPCDARAGSTNDKPTHQRTFKLHYSAQLRDLPAEAKVRIWLPVPQSSPHQQVAALGRDLPGKARIRTEPKYGNKILYVEFADKAGGSLNLATSYRVTRQEVRYQADKIDETAALSPDERRKFLAPNEKVPVTGKPLKLLTGLKLSQEPLLLGRALYDRVDDHMRYDKSKPGYGLGDAVWACDSRFGNCTDFHSLFISLARSQNLPARFEIGFSLPQERGKGPIGGYHCWAFFFAKGHGWLPVDISEADKHPAMKQYYYGNLSENRVAFTIGRDIELAPRQANDPLNYFIYPHVEVDGKVWSHDKIDLKFSFEDL